MQRLPSPAGTVGYAADSENASERCTHLAFNLPFVPLFRIESRHADHTHAWRDLLLRNLPHQSQCDMLTSFYAQHMNWVYKAIEMTAFRKQYNSFWLSTQEADLGWLSLLYAVLCVSVIYIPQEIFAILEFDVANVELADTWYACSRQCLFASGFESKPTLTHLETFITTQLYWHATNDYETLYL